MIWLFTLSSLCMTNAVFLDSKDVRINVDNGTLKGVEQLPRLELLNLSGLGLESIEEDAFNNVTDIKALDLSNNSFANIPQNVFFKLPELEKLSLAKNNLSSITNMSLSLNKLKLLDISENHHLNLSENAFTGLPDNTEIIVNHDSSINTLSPRVFSVNYSLQVKSNNVSSKCRKNTDSVHIEVENMTKEIAAKHECISNSRNKGPVVICMNDGIVTSVEPIREVVSELMLPGCTKVGRMYYRDFGMVLVLDQNNIKGFAKNWFRLSQDYHVMSLYIHSNQISEIDGNMLNDLPPCIEEIAVYNNSIKTIKNNVIKNNYITSLSLMQNGIEKVESEAFKDLPLLSKLGIYMNEISDLQFLNSLPTTLLFLYIPFNNISNIPDKILSRFANLGLLNLMNNTLTEINNQTFSGLNSLAFIAISGNSLTSMKTGIFDDLHCVVEMHLDKNNISYVEKGFAKNLQNLDYINIKDNPLNELKQGYFYGMPVSSHIKVNHLKMFQPGIFKNYS